ncbi:uncharacterized protein NPIL_206191 [Nephila pilipes]|uniref:Uncharacterized protein n=1 Tax=Nephila pilipes TaxID=299642 RepID=A0A8X6MVB7_NEPPI|nr:uncharacterized protein NPIL_206191 [Nephila pilipes]
MSFLYGEVEEEERISLVASSFGSTKSEDMKMHWKKKYNLEPQWGKIPTAFMLLISTKVHETTKPRYIFGIASIKKRVLLMCYKLHTFNETSQKKDEEENFPTNEEMLQQNFYIDSVVASFDRHKDLNNFIPKSSQLIFQGAFYLRDWKYIGGYKAEYDLEIPVLGLKWNRQLDYLKINMN